jgi:hypothetical protein
MARRHAWAILAIAALAAAPALAADDLGSGRRVQGTLSVETVPVGDTDGHVIGVVAFSGLTFFAGGAIAPHPNVSTFDLTDGAGPHQGYVVHRFDDGSTSTEHYQGAVRIDATTGRSVVEGSFTCTGGTGRFAGLQGSGTYRGERLGDLATGAYVYIDFTGSCTVP